MLIRRRLGQVTKERSVTLPDAIRADECRRVLRRPLVTTLPLALLAAWAAPATPAGPVSLSAELPASGDQRFQVYYGDMSRNLRVAEIGYRLDHGGDGYHIGTRGEAIGMVAMFYSGILIQNSVGRIGPAGLRPERYSERRGDRAERVLRFDHARHRMVGLGKPPEVDLPTGTQDRLSVFYQLGLMARSQPSLFRNGARFNLPLASLKRIDTATFSVAGAATVRTARGPVPALHLTVRNEADPEDPTIDVWLGSELSMLPARIRIEESDGKVIDQVLLPGG